MACTDRCGVEIKTRTNVILEESSLAGVLQQWSGEALGLTATGCFESSDGQEETLSSPLFS